MLVMRRLLRMCLINHLPLRRRPSEHSGALALFTFCLTHPVHVILSCNGSGLFGSRITGLEPGCNKPLWLRSDYTGDMAIACRASLINSQYGGE